MKVLPLIGLAMVASMVVAQTPQVATDTDDGTKTIKVPTLRTTDPEEREIETAMANRMVAQQDGWFHDGDFPAIISAMRYQNNVWPFDEESASNLGWMLGNVDQKDEEIAVYMRFMHANPDNPNAPYSAANFYYMKKNYIMAVSLLAPSVKMATLPHPNSYRLLAHGYQRLGFLTESLQAWDLYLPHSKGDAAGYMNRNRVAVLLGKPQTQPGG